MTTMSEKQVKVTVSIDSLLSWLDGQEGGRLYERLPEEGELRVEAVRVDVFNIEFTVEW